MARGAGPLRRAGAHGPLVPRRAGTAIRDIANAGRMKSLIVFISHRSRGARLLGSGTASVALALALGLRHGLDADHLVAIDGATRWTLAERRPFAPFCGALFAAGHSGLILAATLAFALLARQWQPPGWLAPLGAVTAAGTLLVLSAINLHRALAARASHTSAAVGVRSRLFASLLRAPRARHVVLLGALFALSFDAVALAALFAGAASTPAGAMNAGTLAIVFAAGMIGVDAANGFWAARILRHSDLASRRASRVMTLTIALTGALVALCVLSQLAAESLARWLGAYELALSALVIGAMLAGYGGALLVAKRPARLSSVAARARDDDARDRRLRLQRESG